MNAFLYPSSCWSACELISVHQGYANPCGFPTRVEAGTGAGQHLCTRGITRTLAEGFGGFRHNSTAPAICRNSTEIHAEFLLYSFAYCSNLKSASNTLLHTVKNINQQLLVCRNPQNLLQKRSLPQAELSVPQNEAARGRPVDEIHDATKDISPSGSIAAAFERKGKGKVSYSHRQHTRTETRYLFNSP